MAHIRIDNSLQGKRIFYLIKDGEWQYGYTKSTNGRCDISKEVDGVAIICGNISPSYQKTTQTFNSYISIPDKLIGKNGILYGANKSNTNNIAADLQVGYFSPTGTLYVSGLNKGFSQYVSGGNPRMTTKTGIFNYTEITNFQNLFFSGGANGGITGDGNAHSVSIKMTFNNLYFIY